MEWGRFFVRHDYIWQTIYCEHENTQVAMSRFPPRLQYSNLLRNLERKSETETYGNARHCKESQVTLTLNDPFLFILWNIQLLMWEGATQWSGAGWGARFTHEIVKPHRFERSFGSTKSGHVAAGSPAGNPKHQRNSTWQLLKVSMQYGCNATALQRIDTGWKMHLILYDWCYSVPARLTSEW